MDKKIENLKDEYIKIIESNRINTQEQFSKKFKELYGIKPKRSTISHNFKRYHITKSREDKCYFVNNIDALDDSEKFFQYYAKNHVIDFKYGNSQRTLLLLHVDTGREQEICRAISDVNRFKNEQIFIFPGYGSIILLTSKGGIDELKTIYDFMKEHDLKKPVPIPDFNIKHSKKQGRSNPFLYFFAMPLPTANAVAPRTAPSANSVHDVVAATAANILNIISPPFII